MYYEYFQEEYNHVCQLEKEFIKDVSCPSCERYSLNHSEADSSKYVCYYCGCIVNKEDV